LLLAYAMAIALQELTAYVETVDLGPYQDVVEPYLDVSTVVDNPQTLLANVGDPGALVEPLISALGYLGLVGASLLYLFIAITLAFYLLRDGHRLTGYASLVDDEKGVLRAYASAVDGNLRTIYFGNILNAFLTGVLGAVTFSLLNLGAPEAFGIPYPALLGILAGAGSLIPVVGMKIVYVPMLLYLAAQAVVTDGGWGFVTLAAVVSVVVVDTIPDLLLRPYVSGGDLHTGTVMFAYVLGPLIWGWYGLFLGPLVLVVASQFARLILPELLAGTTVQPHPVGPGQLIGTEAENDLDNPANDHGTAGDDPDETDEE
jgi:predicted PurR-regulated permease PerM